jgi:hypothetical protein
MIGTELEIAQIVITPKVSAAEKQAVIDRLKEIKKQCQTRNVYDTCFHLIKLYCNENYSIADTVAPLSHSPNQLDFRLRFAKFNLNLLKNLL